jgi:hypothetical protein
LPQLLVVTPLVVCGVHRFPGAQSVSLFLQLETHSPLAQLEGVQSRTPGCPQLPIPSQVRGRFLNTPEQEDEPHSVFSGKREHPPKPSQLPVKPQVDRSLAMHAGSGKLAGINVHMPHNPVWLHDSQGSLHA